MNPAFCLVAYTSEVGAPYAIYSQFAHPFTAAAVNQLPRVPIATPDAVRAQFPAFPQARVAADGCVAVINLGQISPLEMSAALNVQRWVTSTVDNLFNTDRKHRAIHDGLYEKVIKGLFSPRSADAVRRMHANGMLAEVGLPPLEGVKAVTRAIETIDLTLGDSEMASSEPVPKRG